MINGYVPCPWSPLHFVPAGAVQTVPAGGLIDKGKTSYTFAFFLAARRGAKAYVQYPNWQTRRFNGRNYVIPPHWMESDTLRAMAMASKFPATQAGFNQWWQYIAKAEAQAHAGFNIGAVQAFAIFAIVVAAGVAAGTASSGGGASSTANAAAGKVTVGTVEANTVTTTTLTGTGTGTGTQTLSGLLNTQIGTTGVTVGEAASAASTVGGATGLTGGGGSGGAAPASSAQPSFMTPDANQNSVMFQQSSSVTPNPVPQSSSMMDWVNGGMNMVKAYQSVSSAFNGGIGNKASIMNGAGVQQQLLDAQAQQYYDSQGQGNGNGNGQKQNNNTVMIAGLAALALLAKFAM